MALRVTGFVVRSTKSSVTRPFVVGSAGQQGGAAGCLFTRQSNNNKYFGNHAGPFRQQHHWPTTTTQIHLAVGDTGGERRQGAGSSSRSQSLKSSPRNASNHQNNQQRRRYSSSRPHYYNKNNDDHWEVPKSIDIPVEKIDLSFTRSSGAGGQNVNKVNTKVELRFPVLEAEWLPLEVRQRLYNQQRSRINKKGFLSVTSQEFRTQEKNRKSAVSRLETMILEAYPRPKERKMRTGVSKATKERNKEFKRRRGQVKQSRKAVSSRDW